MLDQPSKNGRSNGHSNAGLVVEDLQNLTFQLALAAVFDAIDLPSARKGVITSSCGGRPTGCPSEGWSRIEELGRGAGWAPPRTIGEKFGEPRLG